MTPTRPTALLPALLAYGVVAVAFSWPLPLYMGSQLTGRITGDTGVYVWNLWVFRHEVVAHHSFPLFTNEILSLTQRTGLGLHNYTLFANLLAFPLIPILGVTISFNVVYLALVTLTAWTMFLLARSVIGRDGEAWLAGLLFGFSPFLVARSEAHFSLIAAAPLPVFMLALRSAARRTTVRNAAIAGVAIAWASMCDAYYGIFCLVIAACYLSVRYVRIRRGIPPRDAGLRRTLDVLILTDMAIITAIAATGGGEWQWGSVRIAARSLYTPVLVLTLLGMARAVVTLHPRMTLRRLPPAGVALGLVAVAGFVSVVIMSPVLYALRLQWLDGGQLQGPVHWRSSPRGVDLLTFFMPNPNHQLFGTPWRAWLTQEPGGYVENVASLTLIGIAIVAIAVWRYRFRPPRVWVALTVVFAALAAGPFLHVAGANTYIPGPWALLRYVPIVSATRMPARFAVVAMMGFSLLVGLALARITRQHPAGRRALLLAAGLALAFELAPFPRQTYPATVPDIYERIANDPRDVRVLELPSGIRDGESSEGNFNASTLFYQTFHEKRLYGGYLSRISKREINRQLESQIIRGLIRLSAGDMLQPVRLEELKGRGPDFVERTKLGYVVIHGRRTPAALRRFAIDAFGLVKVAERDDDELYVPSIIPGATVTASPMIYR